MADIQINQNNTSIIAKGAGVLLVGSMIAYALRYVINIIAAREVGPDAYGIFSLGTSWITIVSTIAMLGIDIGVIRYVAIFRGKDDASRIKGTLHNSLVMVITVGLVISILAFMAAPILSQNIYRKPGLTPILQLFAVSVPFYAATKVMLGGTQGFLKMQYTVYISNLLVPLGRLVLSLLFLALGLSVIGLVWAYVISMIVGAFGSFFFLNKTFYLFDRSIHTIGVTRELLKFSTPLLAVNVLQLVGGQTEVLLLGLFAKVSDVGIYSAALTTALIATIILGAFNSIISPVVSDLHHRGLMDQLESVYRITTKWGLTLTLPISLVMILFPTPLLNIFGHGFSDASMVLIILSLGQLFHISIGSAGTLLTMSGRSSLSLGISFFRFVIVIIFDLVLIPRFNLVGAAVASVCAITLIDLVRLVVVYQQLRIHPFEVTMFKPLVAAGITAIVVYAMQPVYHNYLSSFGLLIIGALVVFLLYGGMVFLFRLESEDRIVLGMVLRRFNFKKMVNK